mmetsp:Transcript_30433/g.50384  ORF Transcript_30433/g.50384 Transcript_30433/m.50384 type:complete len:664 (+) Transcript_30433:66-2057(+)|eukprot:CAMPEP_0119311956 /NCGR_PEP_ID=MMETSP1333-20130426/24521_1 /TAXON_ID=418940 /ORGANISM="Scyphosphaera apsteinii, Strain RCC1455" /LENGTH=663 /DNA_ID=CAMNT_0007316471 /DNA_START=82 /DNA_END=2073 /DNA_ORIENTATION=+
MLFRLAVATGAAVTATTCSQVKNVYKANDCCGGDPEKAVATDVNNIMRPPFDLNQCTPFSEYEVPLRLGVQPVPCQIVPPPPVNGTVRCYDPTKYSFGTKFSQCQAQKDKYGNAVYGANAGQAYPPRRSLSDDTLDNLCYATTCMDGFDGPLLDPVVFEHVVEISTNCLLTPVQVYTLTLLGEDWKQHYDELTGIEFGVAKGSGGREYRGGNPMYQMMGNRQSLVHNKQHNQIPMYTYFQPIYTTITFEFVGAQGYQEALLMLDSYLQYDDPAFSSTFTQAERDALYGKLTSTVLWKKLQKEEVMRCYPTTDAITVKTNNNKPYKTYDNSKFACSQQPRATEAQILQAVRGLVAVETNLQLFGGTDIQSFIPAERLPTLGNIIGDTQALCDGSLPTSKLPVFLGYQDLCLLKIAFCPFDEQSDFSGLSNRQILSVYEAPYFAGSEEWRGIFNLDAEGAFNLSQTAVWYSECVPLFNDADVEAHANTSSCPGNSNGNTCCLNWRRNKVMLPNALETGVHGPPLRKPDGASPTGYKMMPGSSNFDITLPPDQPLSLAEHCTALAENRFKGTIRQTISSRINREDNTLCNFRAALLVDFFQDLEINAFLNYFPQVNTRPGAIGNSSIPYAAHAFGELADGGPAAPWVPPSAPAPAPSSGGFSSDGF